MNDDDAYRDYVRRHRRLRRAERFGEEAARLLLTLGIVVVFFIWLRLLIVFFDGESFWP